MVHAVQTLAAEGRTDAILSVLETNTSARTLHERAGWRPDGATQDDHVGSTSLHGVRYRRPLP